MTKKLTIPNDLLVGRGLALRKSLKLAHNHKTRNKKLTIVEVGTIRDTRDRAKMGDGWSSMLWAWYAKNHKNVEINFIDIKQHHLDATKEIIKKEYGTIKNELNFHLGAAERWLLNFTGKIDLLYLDGSDNPHEMSAQFTIADTGKLFTDHAVLLLDDIGADWSQRGKGIVLVPELMERSDWEMILDDRKSNKMLFMRKV